MSVQNRRNNYSLKIFLKRAFGIYQWALTYEEYGDDNDGRNLHYIIET